MLPTPPGAKSFVLRSTRRNGEPINVVEGLRLHCPVVGVAEEAALIAWVDTLIADGRRGALRGTTYLEPKRWRKGLGRLTVQFGCSYSYMDHRIEVEQAVERMPQVLMDLIERLRRWGVVKRGREPDSAIINIYECDDAISPHIDDHAFVRPFYTMSMVRLRVYQCYASTRRARLALERKSNRLSRVPLLRFQKKHNQNVLFLFGRSRHSLRCTSRL